MKSTEINMLAKLKVGDDVFSPVCGFGKVSHINPEPYTDNPITVQYQGSGSLNYTAEGRVSLAAPGRSIFFPGETVTIPALPEKNVLVNKTFYINLIKDPEDLCMGTFHTEELARTYKYEDFTPDVLAAPLEVSVVLPESAVNTFEELIVQYF